MGKLWMIAGRQVQGSDGRDRFGAYVVYSAGRLSRIFSVRGTPNAPLVTELAAATTIDMRRFEAELEKEIRSEAGDQAAAPVTRPAEALVCGIVKEHLKTAENLDVD